jgi:hypothetical protein
MEKNYIPESEYPKISNEVKKRCLERYGKCAGLRSIDSAIYYWERVIKKEKELPNEKQIENVFYVAEKKLVFFKKLMKK